MPFKPQTTCKHRGCPNTVPIGQRYCAEHSKDERRDNRPSSRERGYTHNWQKARMMYLREHPVCVRCGQAAILIHHIVAITDGGDMYSTSNLQSLCRDCHERVHGRKK